MIATAKLKYIRITARKFRQIIPLIKGVPVMEALDRLAVTNKKACVYATEILTAAVANAKRLKPELAPAQLFVSKIIADGGPTLKRFRAASMGRASSIRKRTSHITVELDELKSPKATTPVVQAVAPKKAARGNAAARKG